MSRDIEKPKDRFLLWLIFVSIPVIEHLGCLLGILQHLSSCGTRHSTYINKAKGMNEYLISYFANLHLRF